MQHTSGYDLIPKINTLRGGHSSRSTSDTESSSLHSAMTETMAITQYQTVLIDNIKHLETQDYLNDDISQNIIYTFTGIQGDYMKKDIITGKLKLDIKAKSLSVIQAGMLLRLSELGWVYKKSIFIR